LAVAARGTVPASEQFVIGGLVARAEELPSGDDPLRALLDALAFMAEVLSAAEDQIANESFVETAYDGENDRVRLCLGADLGPVVCLVIDQERVFVVTIGSEAGEATVRFGDAEQGHRPPAGFEHVAATYRQGEGGAANVELGGLCLHKPFTVIAVSHPAGRQRRVAWAVTR
jgi:hypothetical protein